MKIINRKMNVEVTSPDFERVIFENLKVDAWKEKNIGLFLSSQDGWEQVRDEENVLELFSKLPNLDGANPELYFSNSMWRVMWYDVYNDTFILSYEARGIKEVILKAYKNYERDYRTKQQGRKQSN